MSETPGDKNTTVTETAEEMKEHDDHLEDHEKILAGRHDVNYPAFVTKDVPGG